MAQPIRFKATVKEVKRHGPDVASLRLYSEKRLPRFIPGQFIHLAIDKYDPAGFWPESRVFSVANAVEDRRTVNITVSRQGDYTSRILDDLVAGCVVWGKGPYGDFYIDGDQGLRRSVLIAGGTGITPFCAFMDSALKSGALPVEEVVLYYGAGSTDLLIFRELAQRCAAELAGFSAHYYVERGAELNQHEISLGRLDIDSIAGELGNLDDTAFYLSGPRQMIEAFKVRLTGTHGITNDRVLIDAWD